MNESDEALAVRCRQGDPRACAALVDRYLKSVYNLALWIVGREFDAMRITREVFQAITAREGRPREGDAVRLQLFRLAVRSSLKRLDEEAPGTQHASEAWSAQGLGDKLDRKTLDALFALPAEQRACIALTHRLDCSTDDVARILEIDPTAALEHLCAARGALMRGAFGGGRDRRFRSLG